MKRTYVIIILIIVAIVGVYLNRAYAHIYNEIHNANLKAPEKNQTYAIGNDLNKKDLVYVALGDSLTVGAGADKYDQSYPYLIGEKFAYSNNMILRTRAELGYKSIDIKNVMLPLAIDNKPNIITLLVGVNDIHSIISKVEFQKNYEEIIKQLTTKTTAKIYLINIPYIGSKNLILPPWNYYFDFQTNQFNKIIKNLATKYNLTYIDLYAPTKQEFSKSNSYYSRDLFHPSTKGYAFWADIIYSNIQN
jgi:lysophospholipase L1-like esterase